MWKTRREPIYNQRGEILAFVSGDRKLTMTGVIAGWREDEGFRDFFIAELSATAYPAFFWEMPPVDRASVSDPFECAITSGDALARMRADDSDFVGHLDGTSAPVTSFPNLGGDALLIAPRKMSDADCYGHIAAFVRAAPRGQRHALFQMLARETEQLLEAGNHFWISTSGLGVPWVHVRLDSCPKYYQHRPYAER